MMPHPYQGHKTLTCMTGSSLECRMHWCDRRGSSFHDEEHLLTTPYEGRSTLCGSHSHRGWLHRHVLDGMLCQVGDPSARLITCS